MAGIYIHVPFCRRKCAYCDFYSVARPELEESFTDAVLSELDARLPELGGQPVETIYFGGGTPSMLPPRLLKRIMEALPAGHTREVTIEANPEDAETNAARQWRDIGFNRVSMGVQSLIDGELRIIGRRHSAGHALQAVENLRSGGFTNISLDLMYGLPGQTLTSWQQSVRGVLLTGVPHLSAYLLSYEPGTLLWRRREQGLVEEASGELAEKMYALLCRETAASGLEHYEISNFATPGMHSQHNSSYWDLTPYLGLGPGAHSLGADGVRRFHNANIHEYLAQPATVTVEDENDNERLDDLIIISLRCRHGLDTMMLPPDKRLALIKAAEKWVQRGYLVCNGSTLYIPEQHWLRSDAVIRDLLFG